MPGTKLAGTLSKCVCAFDAADILSFLKNMFCGPSRFFDDNIYFAKTNVYILSRYYYSTYIITPRAVLLAALNIISWTVRNLYRSIDQGAV